MPNTPRERIAVALFGWKYEDGVWIGKYEDRDEPPAFTVEQILDAMAEREWQWMIHGGSRRVTAGEFFNGKFGTGMIEGETMMEAVEKAAVEALEREAKSSG